MSNFLRFILFLVFIPFYISGQVHIVVNDDSEMPLTFDNGYLTTTVSSSDSLSLSEKLENKEFEKGLIPQLFSPDEVMLVSRFTLSNHTDRKLLLDIGYTSIGQLRLYKKDPYTGKYELLERTGNETNFENRPLQVKNFVFDLHADSLSDTLEYIVTAHGDSPVFLPMTIQNREGVYSESVMNNWLYGIYLGVFLALFLYNFFVLLSIKDRSYIPYLCFLIFIVFAQSSIEGFAFQYFWPGQPWINKFSIPVFTSLAGIAGLVFARMFLRIDHFFPSTKVVSWLISFFIFAYAISAVLALFGSYYLSYNLLNLLAISATLFLIIISVFVIRKGYTPAIFYFVAWVIFLMGLIILALRNLSVLPFNDLTTYASLGGAVFEAILFSLALADKINVLRREKDDSQRQALEVSRENERIIREQNILLEQKVQERTLELQESNEELQVTLANLKDTQTQLVDAEKMASLGQLTAGIAHEINNPINFVTSNIIPLRRDLEEVYEILQSYSSIEDDNPLEGLARARQLQEDYDFEYLREEITSLVNGISDGATRTSEIVKGLRTFSRLDEDTIKQASVHEGLESTLILLHNKIRDNVELRKEYAEDMPNIDCYPGKLNQVFMNILNNAIYAVDEKHYAEGEKAVITLRTERAGDKVKIHLEDNGIGMDEQTKRKIFDPFFTTKDVGEGTGLGMSIVFKIIEKHNGFIEVHSEKGKGTEFIITLPQRLPNQFE